MPRTKTSKRPVLKGRGDYDESVNAIKDPLRRMEAKVDHLEKSINKTATVKNAATSIGRTLGNFVNQGELGALAGSALSKYFGHGDYAVKSNSLMGTGRAVPKFDGKRGTRIQEREFLGDVFSGPVLTAGATDFDSASYNVNPTNRALFPWLSQFAGLYDQWEPNGIVLEFVSTSSEFNGASQALGTVVMATDYDPYDPPFPSKQEMENSDYACSTKPSQALAHGLECSPQERPTELLYTGTGNGAPLTSTSLGSFQLATKGCSTVGTVLGELWISYDITFYKKQINTDLTGPFVRAVGSGPGIGDPLLGSNAQISAQQISISDDGTLSYIDFNNPSPGGLFIVNYNITFGYGAGDLLSFVTNNCTLTNQRIANGVSATVSNNSVLVTLTGPNARLILQAKVIDTAFTWELMVYPADQRPMAPP